MRLISIFAIDWLFYIAGWLGIFLINNTLLTMLLYRYDPGAPNPNNLPFLVPSALVGVAMLLSRSSGGITQPIIGYLSDRFCSRWGRRRPFLAVGVLPLVATFILLFNPPFNHTSTGNLVYLIVLLCLFYLALAIYQIPYLALLPALAQTAEERVNLSTLMALFGLLGAAIGGIGSPLLTHLFGFQGMAFIIGSVSFVTLLMPLTVKEEFVTSVVDSPTFWKSLPLVWQNRSFRSYMVGFSSAWIGVSIISICPTFLAVALLDKDISFGAVVNGIFLGSAVSGFALLIPLTRSWGKRTTFQFSMVWLSFGLVAVGILPLFVGTALRPWLGLLLLTNLGLAGFFILPNAMLPDVIEQDRKKFGKQREAIYFGTRGLLGEVSQGLGALLAGMLLMLGKTPAQPWGVQLAFPVAGFFALASAGAFTFYSIKK